MDTCTSERRLVEWLSHQGWRFAFAPGGRSAVAHGTVRERPVVVSGSGRDETEALRRLLAEVSAQALGAHPRAAAPR